MNYSLLYSCENHYILIHSLSSFWSERAMTVLWILHSYSPYCFCCIECSGHLPLRNGQICPLPYKFIHIFSLYCQSVSLPISFINHRLVFYPQICCNIPSGYGMKEGGACSSKKIYPQVKQCISLASPWNQNWLKMLYRINTFFQYHWKNVQGDSIENKCNWFSSQWMCSSEVNISQNGGIEWEMVR